MAESVFHVDGSTSTLLGILNQFHGSSDLNYQTLLNTTINTKHNVLSNIPPPSLPLLRYYGIGINGFYNTDDGSGRSPHQPLPTNLDLYEPIPFRCVPFDNDLSPGERAPYRMREVREIDGVKYCLYWLKVITYTPKVVSILQKSPNGAETPFNIADPTSVQNRLNPVPPVLQTGGITPLTQNRIIVRAVGECHVTNAEISEAINVLYAGNYNRALVSELGFYTGCEIYVTTTENTEVATLINDRIVPVAVGTPKPQEANAIESVYTQLAKHRCFAGWDLSTPGSEVIPTIAFEPYGTIDI